MSSSGESFMSNSVFRCTFYFPQFLNGNPMQKTWTSPPKISERVSMTSTWNAHNNRFTAYTAWGDDMERLCAEILEVNPDTLLVRSSRNRQEILVKTDCTCGFARHDRVHILYDGIMMRSIPPQIQAVRITRAKFNRCPR